jgi:hypothetical protein
MESDYKTIRKNIQKMLDARILQQDYEVTVDSYVCFFHVDAKQNAIMFHAGKMSDFSYSLQRDFVGLYLNDKIGDYKITGIYKITD